MRIHWLQHAPFEDLGSIEGWTRAKNAALRCWRLYEADTLPEVNDFDWLIVMGGPMSVNDEAQYAWLRGEMRLIETAIAQGKTVLGICLGAQLIATAAGARVFRNREPEIGWFPIEPGPGYATDPFGGFLPEVAFHWHGETFDLPRGALHLARSPGCERQAFALNERAIGLQFHLETTPGSVEALLANCANELRPAPFIQQATELRGTEQHYRAINAAMAVLLDTLWSRTRVGEPVSAIEVA
jgi:GMP synthase (glutamine-hydrolysing)